MGTAKVNIYFEGKAASISQMRNEMEGQLEKLSQNFLLEFLGECTRNQSVIPFLAALCRDRIKAVPSLYTYLPRDMKTKGFLSSAFNILNEDYEMATPIFVWNIHSTSEAKRKKKFDEVVSLVEISKLLDKLPEYRAGKITLLLSPETDVDVRKLRNVFDPKTFQVQLSQAEGLGLGIDELKTDIKKAGYEIA